ncbi:hypothetical protein IMCC3317_40640 [Kordia antarctica]|uniref:Type II methyltransferase M.TaqI-like domain-containing protein n=1 Tax=Kordia antarctica TaxID=1218801 RepID=A0A7L4ZQ86_9FLAO|nr:N-6 DNA methylase [Kordia antarctica]QHI38670.1 hypothetical protein IMCC3317_40640 [Kordia antarctica]
MNVHVIHNTAKNGIEIVFSNPIEKQLIAFLQKLGFKNFFKDETKWYADYHLAYVRFANDLKKAIESDTDWSAIPIVPSFEASELFIEKLKFCIVEIRFKKKEYFIKDGYLVFENYKRIATIIAERFALKHFGTRFDSITIYPRNYKTKAKDLFDLGAIIGLDAKGQFLPVELPHSLWEYTTDHEDESINEDSTEVITVDKTHKFNNTGILENQPDFDKLLILEVIDELVSIEQTTKVTDTRLIQTLITEIEEASTIMLNELRLDKLKHIIRLYKEWFEDFPNCFKASVAIAIRPLIVFTNESFEIKSFATNLVFSKYQVDNVLVPLYVHECFQKGSIPLQHIPKLKIEFPYLFKVTIETLHKLSEFELFELSQLKNYSDLGININCRDLNRYWQINGFDNLEKLGYSTDLQYPYVSLIKGYVSVKTLEQILDDNKQSYRWLYLIQNFRPIADLAKGIDIIDRKIKKLAEKLADFKKGKSLLDISYTELVKKRKNTQEKINALFESKKCIEIYIENMLSKQLEQSEFIDTDVATNEPKIPKFYFDSFAAGMSLLYYKHKKPTLSQIESLSTLKKVPNKEALGEAIELSAIDHFRSVYRHANENYVWIDGMRHFWENLQFDRSFTNDKERFEHCQILPLPIAMMIARYLQMNEATSIFDPTAGSGNLLVGANQRVTHANELCKLKRKSLKFSNFNEITNYDPTSPYPKEMHKSFDVVVCNPPFIKSTKTKNEKLDIIEQHLDNAYFMADTFQVQRLISALALLTMKDDGKAVLVVNTHIVFDEKGRIKHKREFLNWLYMHYTIRDIINLDTSIITKDENKKQKKMLILIDGRKIKPSYNTPTKENQPHLADVIGSFYDLWERFKRNQLPSIDVFIEQLKIALGQKN